MSRATSYARPVRRVIALVGGVAFAFLANAAVSLGITRYAAPTGSGTDCTQASPCGLKTAVEVVAQPGDEVVVLPGDYSLGFQGLTVDSAIDVHGVTGQPRPRIASGGNNAIDVEDPGARVAELDIEHGGAVDALRLSEGTAERVVAHTTSTGYTACFISNGAVLRDSVCWTAEPFAAAIYSAVGGVVVYSPQLLNVTAIATGTASNGILVDTGSGAQVTVTGKNVIARGAGPDIAARTDSSPGVKAAITLDHSNFADPSVSGTNASATTAGSPTNQTAAPVFANGAAGDFRELAASVTIDAGTTSALLGALDFDGEARIQGAAPDIGADEFTVSPPPPPAQPPPPAPPPPLAPPLSDTVAPTTTITKHPRKRTKKHGATFKFISNEQGSTFECKLDRRRFKPCHSPKRYRHLRSGRHIFKVRATDLAGNTDATPAKWRWKVKAG
jgi:hypothetical protein